MELRLEQQGSDAPADVSSNDLTTLLALLVKLPAFAPNSGHQQARIRAERTGLS